MAKVIREGHSGVMSIKAKLLVPGDIVEVSGKQVECVMSCVAWCCFEPH